MASPESPSWSRPSTTPQWLASSTPQAIRDALVGAERVEFVQRYSEEMSKAAKSLDLTGVLTVLDTFRKVADLTRRHGAEAHARMLAQVADLEAGRDVETISGADHRAEINTKLGL